ncbi:MAG: hypothetical protein ABSG70_15430 [Terriglobales bacterium]|jgi:hypothetical protein
MTCSDVDRILPDIIDGASMDGNATSADQDFELQSHLSTCPDCSELVSDLRLIAGEARQLSDTDEPAPRVWVRIATQLRAEGLIRDPELPGLRTVVATPPRRQWRALWLAPVAILALAAGSLLLHQKTTSPVTPQIAKQPLVQQPETPVALPETQVAQQPASPSNKAVAPTPRSSQTAPEQAEISPPAGIDDQQFLSEVSSRAPSMRAAYETQLQAVNNEIRETQAYIRQYPGDMDARQHLMEVYQQKAMLYQMALDRIQ